VIWEDSQVPQWFLPIKSSRL